MDCSESHGSSISEMLVCLWQSTHCHIPDDWSFCHHDCEKLKCHIYRYLHAYVVPCIMKTSGWIQRVFEKVMVTTPQHARVITDGKVVVLLYLFLTLALGGSWWSMPCPGHFYPQKRTSAPLVQKAVWASGVVWKGMEKRKSFFFSH